MPYRHPLIVTLPAILLLALTSLWSWADGAAPETQRQRFLAAEKALQRGQLKRYEELAAGLEEYPLYPYLRFQSLKRRLSRVSSQQARSFLDDYQGSPLADRFLRSWLDELQRRRDWEQYLVFYRPGSSEKRQCHHLQALLNSGRTEQAFEGVADIWLTGHSLPDACDPVLAAWRQAGRLTPERVWARIDLAMQEGSIRLARYLGRYLPAGEERDWLDRWLQLHRQPERLLALGEETLPGEHPYREKILLHAVKRLARKDATRAADAWRRIEGRFPFTGDQRYQARRALAIAMIDADPPDLLQRLESLEAAPEDTRLLELRIRTGLKYQAWKQVLSWIDALPTKLAETERWRYWKARALEQLGVTETADRLYTELAGNRSFYGFLAADRRGRPYNLSHTPLEVPAGQLSEIAAGDGFRRARELYLLGRQLDARREWRAATAGLDDTRLQAASKLAQSWGWHTQAIFTLARTGYWEDLELRFPVQHRQTISQAARRQQLDNAWVYAVIRQESAFASDARSPAGALGLMQLMPRTARTVAKRLKKRPPKRRDLLTPATNIELGTAYLGQVLALLGDNPVLATSAYNAGPHRVKQWLPEFSIPADLWIETIPFRETRRYTQRVLTYAVIYDQRLGRTPERIASRMPEILPRPVATASRDRKRATPMVPAAGS